jgi:hypothetical protein
LSLWSAVTSQREIDISPNARRACGASFYVLPLSGACTGKRGCGPKSKRKVANFSLSKSSHSKRSSALRPARRRSVGACSRACVRTRDQDGCHSRQGAVRVSSMHCLPSQAHANAQLHLCKCGGQRMCVIDQKLGGCAMWRAGRQPRSARLGVRSPAAGPAISTHIARCPHCCVRCVTYQHSRGAIDCSTSQEAGSGHVVVWRGTV